MCLLGKKQRFPFSTGREQREKNLLELIHTDVHGLMRTPSHENNMYFILFINDISNYICLFTKIKIISLWSIKNFKALIENQSGKQIKVLRSDHDKYYTFHKFYRFCEDEGIKIQLIVSYSPQQNGVSERKNHIDMEMVISILKEKGLPNIFQVEVVHYLHT